MPRDGSGVYHRPVGTDAVTDTTIESTKYNANVADVEADLNTPRPIVAGGTGSNSVAGAIANLGAESAKQIVTNYATQVFLPGSFYSAAAATGAPVAGHAFSGICYQTDANNMFLEARDQDDATNPGHVWVRQMKASVWGAWANRDYDTGAASQFVEVTGDTMTGDLNIIKSNPALRLQKAASGEQNLIFGMNGANIRWRMALGDATAESGSNVGSDFAINRYDDSGALLGVGLTIPRNTGLPTIVGDPTAALGIVTKQYADAGVASAKSYTDGRAVRYDAAQGLTGLQKTVAQQNIGLLPAMLNYISGVQMSWAAATTMQIGPGVAADSTNTDMMYLAAPIAKTMAAWAVGSSAGGLDTGAIANNSWYYFWLIKRPDTGVVDVLFSLSVTTPTMPPNYTLKRRIGAMRTNASAQWMSFNQYGDEFYWGPPITEYSAGNPGNTVTGITLAFAPPNLAGQIKAIFNCVFTNTVSVGTVVYLWGAPTGGDPSSVSGAFSLCNPVANQYASGQFSFWVSNTPQIFSKCNVAANNQLYIDIWGWQDLRGRLG